MTVTARVAGGDPCGWDAGCRVRIRIIDPASDVVVLKALGGNPKLPFFAMLTQGFPRLVTVQADQLLDDAEAESELGGMQRPGVLNPVLLRDDPADACALELKRDSGAEQA